MNTRGLRLGKFVQNVFTITKTGALIALIVLGIVIGLASGTAAHANFGNFWAVRGKLQDVGPGGLTAITTFGLFVGICVSQTNSLFSADAWNNITFTAGEVKNPKRNIPLSLAFGTMLVIALVPAGECRLSGDAAVRDDSNRPKRSRSFGDRRCDLSRRGRDDHGGLHHGFDLWLQQRFDSRGRASLLGDGARRIFFKSAGELNNKHVPAWGLVIQGIWAAALVLPRTITGTDPATGAPTYGNLYGDLLTYVISAALIFYILTIAGIFRLRQTRPDVERPYRAFGYPIVPALYIIGAAVILAVLLIYQTATTWPGFIIIATGIPVYFIWRKVGEAMPTS